MEVARYLKKKKNFDIIMQVLRVLDEWKKVKNMPNFKKNRSKIDCGNYRGMILSSVSSNSFMRVLLNETKSKMEDGLRNEQAGFRGGRSILDQIYPLKQV